ncbi:MULTISPECIES: caspase family protein [Sphingomonadales]|uniref:caspase family protein n=2 Tax=Alphaproteobacteria TaxID=28211 RepID=UPI00083782A5|nr:MULTISPECIES: caspase family protein [Sphingomonadales]
MKRSMTALVIGNADYPDGHDLMNPVHDADDFGAKLKGYGFEAIVVTDCTAKEMEKSLKLFRASLDKHDVGLFFFAGHGMQIEGSNYLLALDTDMDSETDAKHSSLSLDKVVDVMSKSTAATKIIILDACRNNPWERKWQRSAATRGLASVYAPKGTIIGFATSPGETAGDGDGRNGTYTAALLDHIDAPDCSIETMFKRVRNTVAAATKSRQTSWEHTSLAGEFYFNMSLGKLITEYDGTALADGLFVLDVAKKSHKIIAGLKTHDWYRQNPALALLTPEAANKMAPDSLFVLGRNIYQAACGTSAAATSYVNDFVARTATYEEAKRKAILDGMLFEIFFDASGKLRTKIKSKFFDTVFDLQRVPTFRTSFDFIADALIAANADYHVVPGKGQDLAVTISTIQKKSGPRVDAIYIGGVDVLKVSDDAWDTDEGDPIYFAIAPNELAERLSEDLAVPARNLKLTYSPNSAAKEPVLRIALGWTVRK